jgi:hypothetical protein
MGCYPTGVILPSSTRATGKLMYIITPSGFEGFFEEIGALSPQQPQDIPHARYEGFVKLHLEISYVRETEKRTGCQDRRKSDRVKRRLGLCASWQVNFRPQRGWRGSPHFRLCGEKGPLFGCSAKAGATGATYWTATTTLPAPLTVLCAHFGPRAKIQQKLAKETKNFVVFAGHC